MKYLQKVQLNTGKERLLSLDALRGFDMLWIIGGESVIKALAKLSNAGWLNTLAKQMEHIEWEGIHLYDLIFPLFMFIMGIAIPLSMKSKLASNKSKKDLSLKVLIRMAILILLGILYNGDFRDGFANARYTSILAQIGIAYFFASMIVLYSKSFKLTLYWLFGILAGVTILQLFVPVPGIGAGVLTPEGSMNRFLDVHFLPGRLAYDHGLYDALGWLSIVSAIGITLMGTIAGNIIQRENLSGYRKVAIFAVVGAGLIILGLIFSPYYPIIKKVWTTTYNLVAGGISFLLFALFYLVIDIWRIQKWSFPFRVIGLNSIFIYLFVQIIPVATIVQYFLGFIITPLGDGGLWLSFLGCLIGEWLLLYYMYRKNIFIKV